MLRSKAGISLFTGLYIVPMPRARRYTQVVA